jgi:Tfp pilus assembly protein PilO
VIWPKFNEVVKLRSENVHLDERAKALEDKVKILGEFSQKELEAKFVLSEKLIPSDKAVFSMVTQVEKAASISGVILDKLDLVPGSASDQNAASGDSVVSATGVAGDTGTLGVDTPRIQIRVSIISDYLSLLRFLNLLLDSQRAVTITDLAIGSDSTTSGGGGSLKSSMVVNAFWKPIPKELPAIETPISQITEAEAKLLNKIANVVEATISAEVPRVPLGRPDLFAPF